MWERHGDQIGQVWIVLPTRRAGLFLKDRISQKAEQALFVPPLFTFSEFVHELTECDVPDELSALFELYEIYRQVNGVEAEPFDQFVKWGRTLLHDFNDIHLHLLEPEKVFSNLRAVRDVENWSLGGETLSDGQKQYLSFYDQFLTYHDKFTQHLDTRNKMLEGQAFRLVAEAVEQYSELLPPQGVVFAGFNALTPSEERIVTQLARTGKAKVYWDADRYYLDHPVQEAGHFLRRYRAKWDLPFDWADTNLSQGEKEVEIIGVPGQVGQAKVAGDLLQSMGPDHDFKSTVVALADEQLLLPTLNSLPDLVKRVNVTMGYPLKYTPLHSLFEGIMVLHENARRLRKPGQNVRFYHQDVLKILHHPSIRRLMQVEGQRNLADVLVRKITEKNKVFFNFNTLEEIAAEAERSDELLKLQFLLTHLKKVPHSLLSVFSTLIDVLKDIHLKGKLKSDPLELEYLYHYYKVIKRLQVLLGEFPFLEEIRSFRSLFNQVASGSGLNFFGEPMRGLQVMGMLETRAVDFDTVILLAANENTLPQARNDRSFIPFDLRRHFRLPTHHERDAIYAYSFYRLLQRAKKVYLIYNTETDDFGSGERSRFITQIIHEWPRINPKVKLTEKVLAVPVRTHEAQDFTVVKTPDMLGKLDKLFTSGLSPTALTTYINCPLDFYYKYILGLKERNEVEETVELSSFGTFVHQTLESFYEPYVGQKVPVEAVESMIERIEPALLEKFEDRYTPDELQFGKNYLLFRVATTFLERFLDSEKEFIAQAEAAGDALKVIGLEEELRSEFTVKIGEEEKIVGLRGEADRIDHVGGRTRIIDYKTGKVSPRDLRIEHLNEATNVPRYHKCFQVLMYALLYRRNHPEAVMPLQSGILSFRNLSEGLMNIQVSKNDDLDDKLLADFEGELKKLVKRIYDVQAPFQHNPESTWCAFCAGHS